MSRAYVLMTAMPPTKGHLHLIEFAAQVGTTAEVIIATQPGEPFVTARVQALQQASKRMPNVNIHHIHRELPQEPEHAPGFWDMWADFLYLFGFDKLDYIVASELYGAKLAEHTGSTFIPYDLSRTIYYSKATNVRDYPLVQFEHILPEFQDNLKMRVTIFGAESCGKTTLSQALGFAMNAWVLPEWARPYLETVGADLTEEKMRNIWIGQRALQRSARTLQDKPLIIQDTDLYSTIGYWELHPELGTTPDYLFANADTEKSDLYIIAPSNIPFEEDQLRYGGDKRESDDQFWIDMCRDNELNFYVLRETTRSARLVEALQVIEEHYGELKDMKYNRL